jgi:alpha-tubulin suppressor-like RCC1 family protein
MSRQLVMEMDGADEMVVEMFTFLSFEETRGLAYVNKRFCRIYNQKRWIPELLLYHWGAVEHGYIAQSPQLLQFFYTAQWHRQPKQIACSNNYTYILTNGGEVYSYFVYAHGCEMRKIEGFEGHRIARIEVSCPGYKHLTSETSMAALSDNGTFFEWSENISRFYIPGHVYRTKPEIISYFPGQRVVLFSCGVSVTAMSTVDGEGTWHTHQRRGGEDPKEIYELRGVPLKQLVCGGWFFLALTVAGKVLSWGDPLGPDVSNGSLLGRGPSRRIEDTPGEVIFPAGVTISRVAASTYSALAIAEESGHVFTWGDHDGNALGHICTTNVPSCHVPEPLDVSGHGSIIAVDGVLSYTNGGIVASDGSVYMWGGLRWTPQGISRYSGCANGRLLKLEWNDDTIPPGFSIKKLAIGSQCGVLIIGKDKP